MGHNRESSSRPPGRKQTLSELKPIAGHLAVSFGFFAHEAGSNTSATIQVYRKSSSGAKGFMHDCAFDWVSKVTLD